MSGGAAKRKVNWFISPANLSYWTVNDDAPLPCEYDFNVYLAGRFRDNGFTVSRERGLYDRAASYKEIRQSNNFCVTSNSTVYANGSIDLIAMICVPKNFSDMRWMLHNIYSIVNLIIALLLRFIHYINQDNLIISSPFCVLSGLVFGLLEFSFLFVPSAVKVDKSLSYT